MPKMNLLVVDISHHNPITSFDKLYKSGIRGVIHKASQGTGMIDVFYKPRKQAALDAGLLWGAYHFADGSDPYTQALHFMEAAQPDKNTLMALDYEPNNNSTMNIKGARVFLETLDGVLSRNNVLYSGNLIKETLKLKDAAGWWKKHPLWLAQYGQTLKLPAQWDEAFLWQFSDGAVNVQGTKVDGVSGAVDRNHFNGSEADLKAKWVIATEPVKEPETITIIPPPEAAVATAEPEKTFWQRLFG